MNDLHIQNQLEEILDQNISTTENQIEAIKTGLNAGDLQPTDEALDALNYLNDRLEVLTATRLQAAYIQIIPVEPDDIL